jgi:hypothetical protein
VTPTGTVARGTTPCRGGERRGAGHDERRWGGGSVQYRWRYCRPDGAVAVGTTGGGAAMTLGWSRAVTRCVTLHRHRKPLLRLAARVL